MVDAHPCDSVQCFLNPPSFLHKKHPFALFIIFKRVIFHYEKAILIAIPVGQYLKTQNAVIKNREDPIYREYLEDTKNAQAGE